MPDIETENDAREAVALALNRIQATAARIVEIKAKLTAAASRIGGFVVKAADGEEVPAEEWDSAVAEGRRLGALASRQLAVLDVQRIKFLNLLAAVVPVAVAACRGQVEAGRWPTCASE